MNWILKVASCAALLGILICSTPLSAQPVQQSGNVTPTHLACWTTEGTIQDCGTSNNPFATTIGSLGPICTISASTSGPYQQFCLTALSSGGQLSIQNFGGAPVGGISFNINGTPSSIPTIPASTTAGNAVCWLNTTGGLGDCGFVPLTQSLPSADIFVGNGSNIATARALSGDCSISNSGAITCTKTNGSSFAPLATKVSPVCSDLTNSSASCSTDATNAGNISSGTLAIARGGTNNSSSYSSGSIIFSDGAKLTQNNTSFYWDNSNIRICIGAGAGCPFTMSVIGVGQWGVSAAGDGIRFQYGSGTSSGTEILGINYNNNAFNQIALSGTGNDDLSVSTSGAVSVRTTIGFTNIWASSTAPTISAGFCATSPSIAASNGTTAFDINVGTSCSGSTGTLSMPAATTGWACSFVNVTNNASNTVSQTGGATNTVTLTNYARTTGLAANFTASDHIRAMCFGY